MVVPAEERKSSDHYTFDCNGICVPLVSSSGHGKADIKRLHYQEGKFALANTMAVLKVKNEEYINPKYLFEVLSEYKDIILTPLMSGATNVTMDPDDLENVVIPIPDKKTQKLIVERAEIFNSLEKLNQVDFSFLHEINDEYKEIEKRLNEMIIKLTNKMNSLKSIKEIFDDYFEM
jgi:type I restriction enzyme M protein